MEKEKEKKALPTHVWFPSQSGVYFYHPVRLVLKLSAAALLMSDIYQTINIFCVEFAVIGYAIILYLSTCTSKNI